MHNVELAGKTLDTGALRDAFAPLHVGRGGCPGVLLSRERATFGGRYLSGKGGSE